MKKAYYLVGLLIVLPAIVFPTEGTEPKKNLSLGISAGGFPFYSGGNSLIISGDIGFQLSRRIGMKADISYTQCTDSFESRMNGYIDQFGESTYSAWPVNLSFLFKSVINNIVSVDTGIGVGYYPIKIEEEYSRYTPQSGLIKESYVFNIHRIAPHFLIALESLVTREIAIIGEIRHVLGKASLEKLKDDYSFKNDFFFGGTYILVGIRFRPF